MSLLSVFFSSRQQQSIQPIKNTYPPINHFFISLLFLGIYGIFILSLFFIYLVFFNFTIKRNQTDVHQTAVSILFPAVYCKTFRICNFSILTRSNSENTFFSIFSNCYLLNFKRKVCDAQTATIGNDDTPFDHISQFTDISLPGIPF